MSLILRPPTLKDENAFMKIKETPVLNNQTFLLNFKAGMSYEDFLQVTNDHSIGRNLPDGFVPASFYFGFLSENIVGRLAIRWQLNDYLLNVAGHIGFVVLPEHQKKGYATEMLQQSLTLAQSKGLDRVLLTCDDDNLASIRTIEKSKGRLENIYTGPEVKKPKRRYWISIG